MTQALFLSIAAGIASALLSGVMTPGSLLAGLLFFIAPLPLLIAGLGWHPLLAALGALVGCLLMSLGLSSKAALFYGLVIGLPSYLLCELVLRLLRAPASFGALAFGRVAGTALLGGIGAYAAVVTLLGALSIDTSHAAFLARVAASVEEVFRLMFADPRMSLPQGVDAAGLAKLYAHLLPSMLTFLISAMLTLSLWLAMKVVRRSGRLPVAPPPAYMLSLPREALFVFIGGMGLAQLGGYAGMFGTLVMVAGVFAMMINGFTLLHVKTLGQSGRSLMLGAAWGAVLVFGIPAFAMALVGALDAAFDFRRPKDGATPII